MLGDIRRTDWLPVGRDDRGNEQELLSVLSESDSEMRSTDSSDRSPAASEASDEDMIFGYDCDDASETTYPGAEEDYSDDIDQDCDGSTETAATSCTSALTLTRAQTLTPTPTLASTLPLTLTLTPTLAV